MSSLASADIAHIFEHEIDWNQLFLENIFVTGGTGFIGRWLLESFADANANLALQSNMVVLTRDPEAAAANAPELAANPAIHFVRGDVRHFDRETVLKQLPKGHSGYFRFVIHAATEASAQLNETNPLQMIDTAVDGTRRALDFAIASGTRRFLLTSSGAVYGTQPPQITHVPEDYSGAPDCNNPRSAYGEGKRLAELLCACYSRHGLEPVIARGFAFVGPLLPLDIHFAVGNFIRDALAGGPIRIGGDGTPCRSYLYAADLAIWLWKLLFHGQPNRPYNVGSEHSLSIAELAALVAECSGQPIEVRIANSATPGAPPSRYVPDTRRARRELGLETWIPLPEALRRTFAWHRSAP
jgi:dTDP-glucose 4,6-dehydratase